MKAYKVEHIDSGSDLDGNLKVILGGLALAVFLFLISSIGGVGAKIENAPTVDVPSKLRSAELVLPIPGLDREFVDPQERVYSSSEPVIPWEQETRTCEPKSQWLSSSSRAPMCEVSPQ